MYFLYNIRALKVTFIYCFLALEKPIFNPYSLLAWLYLPLKTRVYPLSTVRILTVILFYNISLLLSPRMQYFYRFVADIAGLISS